MPHLSNYEKETILLYNDEEKTAIVETANAALQRRLDEYCGKNDAIKCVEIREPFKKYILPKRWIKVQMPRQFSEEEREKMRIKGRELYEKYLQKQDGESADD